MSKKCICVAQKLYDFLNMLQPWHPRSLFRSSTLHSDWTFDFFQPWCSWFGNDRVSDESRSYRSMLATVGSRILESWTSLLSCRIFGLFGTEFSDVKFLAFKWPTVCRWFLLGNLLEFGMQFDFSHPTLPWVPTDLMYESWFKIGLLIFSSCTLWLHMAALDASSSHHGKPHWTLRCGGQRMWSHDSMENITGAACRKSTLVKGRTRLVSYPVASFNKSLLQSIVALQYDFQVY